MGKDSDCQRTCDDCGEEEEDEDEDEDEEEEEEEV
jgi:hypothetical protein